MPSRNILNAPPTGRWLGLDVGSVRVGVAISDTNRTTALPKPPLPRTWKQLKPALETIVKTYQISTIILGYPLNMDGTESKGTQSVTDLALLIEKDLKLPTFLIDERLTSHQAEQAFFEQRDPKTRQTRASKKQSIGKIDSPAATLILQQAIATCNSKTLTP
ncbi:MAG: Holliday junction resolvase RuvX [Proteobacteria bacterium]|nr:Holliday junction resolvase RuvX [Pseudomonadota bacterium]NBX86377.1 Holliday junction resolvase RuvX [Pseudomonadota bacterium]